LLILDLVTVHPMQEEDLDSTSCLTEPFIYLVLLSLMSAHITLIWYLFKNSINKIFQCPGRH
jgi:hypothetical protein